MYSAVSWIITEYQRWGSESALMVVLGASFLSVSRLLLTASKAGRPVVTAAEPRMEPVRPTIRMPKERMLRAETMPAILVASSHEQVEVEVAN